MICAVIKNSVSIKEFSSVRNAKVYAMENGARLILVFETEISSTLHNLHLSAAYYRRMDCKIFETYTPEQYQRLVERHLI